MLHVVDFRTPAGDTGEPDAPSIQPYNNGESADQTVFRRPTENNRTRTEALRDVIREHILLKDYNDGGAVLAGGGTITPSLGGSGMTFTMGSNLYVLPFATPGGGAGSPWVVSTKSTVSAGTGVNELVFTSVQKQFEGDGGGGAEYPECDVNKISVEILDGGVSAALTVVVEGAATELNNIKITIDAAAHTLNNVIAAVAGHATAPNLVVASLGGSAVGTNLCPLFGPAEWGSDLTARFLRGGAPGIAHEITPAGLVTFFSNPLNELDDGETLAIAYDKVFNKTTTGGRVQSTPENTNINVDLALFNTRRYPEKIPNCIPICKKATSTNELTFINGATIYNGAPATLKFDSYASLYSETGKLGAPLTWDRMATGTDYNPPTNIRQALDNADGHIDNILDEIEAARSTDFTKVGGGAFADLDARLDAHGGHVSGYYSLGPGGSGAMYTNLKTCLTDVIAAGGGTIFVKGPTTYTVTGAGTDLPEITAPVRIIGMTSNALTITSTRGADTRNVLGFVLRVSSNHCHFENVVIVNGALGSNWAVLLDGALTTSFVNCGLQGGVVVAGSTRVVTFDRCSFNEPSNVSGEENFGLLYISDGVNTTYYPTGITGVPSDITVRNCEFDGQGGTGIGLVISGPSLVYFDVATDIPNLTVARGLFMRDCTLFAATGYGAIRSNAGGYDPLCSFDNIEVYTEAENNNAPAVSLSDWNVSVKNMTIIVYSTPASDRIGQTLFTIGGGNPYGRSCVVDGLHIHTRSVVPTATVNLLYIQGAVTIKDFHIDITLPDNTNHSGTVRSVSDPLIRLIPNVRGETTLKDSWIRLYTKSTPGTIPGLVCGDTSHQASLGGLKLDNVVFDSTAISGDGSTDIEFYFVNRITDCSVIQNCTFRLGTHVARAMVRYRCNGIKITGCTFFSPDAYLSSGAHIMMDSSGLTVRYGMSAVIEGNKFFGSYGAKIRMVADNNYEPFGITIVGNTFGNPAYQIGWPIYMTEIGTASAAGATIYANNAYNHSSGFLFNPASVYTLPLAASITNDNIDGGNVGSVPIPTA